MFQLCPLQAMGHICLRQNSTALTARPLAVPRNAKHSRPLAMQRDCLKHSIPRRRKSHGIMDSPMRQWHQQDPLPTARRRSCSCNGIATSRSSSSTAAGPEHEEFPRMSAARVERLETLIRLRKLYRNLLRADRLLAQPTPVYQLPKRPDRRRSEELSEEEEAEQELERRQAAVEVVGEMQLTAEQLKGGVRALLAMDANFGELVFRAESAREAEARVTRHAREIAAQLSERARKEVRKLPFPNLQAAQAALDVRNARYKSALMRQSSDDDDASDASERVKERLEQAERAVEKFVSRRLKAVQPGLEKARTTPVSAVVGGISSGANYAKGLWDRLNGGGRRMAAGSAGLNLPYPLPMPVDTRATRTAAIAQLSRDIDALEQKLQEASKVRESKVRRAGIGGRARLAGELRDMDDEVGALSRALAVRTLQLELEYICGCLEDEALDIGQGTQNPAFLLSRQGTSDEVALLVAEFALLDGPIATLAEDVDKGEAGRINEDELARLAVEIPDLRMRLGIGDARVFAGTGWTLVRAQATMGEGAGKIREGIGFFTRGVRLLGSDVSSAGRLFYRAGAGASLRPREVQALRRTARDLLTFIPFAIILIAPLTPVGHVLIFSFLQKYFPGFFPSQFTSRRQELMTRYEELKKQLAEAQEAAQLEDEEAELARAESMLARLTSPALAAASRMAGREALTSPGRAGEGYGSSNSSVGRWSEDERNSEGPAARAVRNLEQQVAAAAEKATTGSVDMPQDERRREQS
ncbi:hypothetical protein CVIRNUC_006935 [Coccomyxa viridis]|uniref:Letm1 RBD domain-containing protein n=1 Tax=Coccomyxa viridis TaxID=1274662 RepID=A0AAV1I8Q5_9CHLO|nr:hypothetical protein CVIRNUC_006935 [Coccomyxa viridis]